MAQQLPEPQQRAYFRQPAVRDEIRAVCEEYLGHYAHDHVNRSFYAAYCYLCERYAEADQHFRLVGDNLAWSSSFPEAWMKQIRDAVARQAQPPPQEKPPEPRE